VNEFNIITNLSKYGCLTLNKKCVTFSDILEDRNSACCNFKVFTMWEGTVLVQLKITCEVTTYNPIPKNDN